MSSSASARSLEALVSWVAVAAPGALLACSLLAITLSAAPWLTRLAQVAPVVRLLAVALLPLHLAAAILVLQRGKLWPPMLALALLVLDAFGAGILLGADFQLGSPALAIAVVVLLMNLMAGGWLAALDGAIAIGFGTSGAMLAGASGLVGQSPPVWLSKTVLDPELVFAGVPVVGLSAPPLPTASHAEPYLAGVSAVTATSQLFIAACAIGVFAVCMGVGVTLVRARQARAAMIATDRGVRGS